MRKINGFVAGVTLATVGSVSAAAQGAAAPAATPKKVVRSVTDLPVYSYTLPAAPSAMLAGPVEPLLALADAVERDDVKTLAEYDIADLSAREAIIGRRVSAALLRRDVPRVRALVAELRAIQQRPDRKLTAGFTTEIVAEACVAADPQATATRLATERLSALPWAQTDTWMKQTRAGLSTANPELVIGGIKQQLDPIVARNEGKVNQGVASGIIGARAALDCQFKVAPQLAAAFTSVIDKQSAANPVADIWAARNVDLAATMPGKPVGVAIWDSGVDLSLFTPTADRGLAIDGAGNPMQNALLRPVGAFDGKTGPLMDLVKGAMDLQAGQFTPEATAFQTRMRGMRADEVKAFSESMGFVSQYVHGTHVAGIAVAGNPFARVKSVAMHWPYRQEEQRVDRAIVERRAAFYRDAVARMRAGGVRVVNMSWRVGPAMFDGILQLQGGHTDAVARRKLARELFDVEKAALEAAMASAPEILFVAGAGNEANDSTFADYIPAGLKLPNLLTVGAVDRGGREALFTSIGGTVAVYANGVEVESFFPGGARRKLSGTSMASPQVANLAAKLVAMQPSLTGAQLRELIVSTAEPQGRVTLVNPRAAFAKAGIALPR